MISDSGSGQLSSFNNVMQVSTSNIHPSGFSRSSARRISISNNSRKRAIIHEALCAMVFLTEMAFKMYHMSAKVYFSDKDSRKRIQHLCGYTHSDNTAYDYICGVAVIFSTAWQALLHWAEAMGPSSSLYPYIYASSVLPSFLPSFASILLPSYLSVYPCCLRRVNEMH